MSDKKFTDEEIIRNYEWCIGCTSDRCIGCTMDEEGFCEEELQDLVLDLTNRQKSEIERLLQKLQQAKFEAIKEFAEKLKKRFYLSAGRCVVDVYHIDNLLKEMVGEEE